MVSYGPTALLFVLGASLLSSSLTAAGDDSSASALQVNVYEGPKECDDSDRVQSGSYLKMHYTGKIDESSEAGEKGSKFDSSRDRGKPFDVQIGVGQVIQGWDQGIVGLCKGAKATLVIPPELGYGERGAGDAIPGGATLNFDVEVVDILEGPPPQPNLFVEIDTDKDLKISKEEIGAFFKSQGREMPDDKLDELFASEDKDGDGSVSWEEFGGPKGDAPPSAKDEL